MEQNDKALADFACAIKLHPNYPEAYMNRGQTLSRMRQLQKALADFAYAIKLRPDYPEAYMYRAITLARTGQFEKALAAFDRAVELRPGYAEARFEKARTLCFAVQGSQQHLSRKECLAEAIDLLESAVDIDNRLLAKIVRERNAFSQLKTDPDHGPRFDALVWERDHRKDQQG
jgi:tetratricopeptide (TPR) repeat protein